MAKEIKEISDTKNKKATKPEKASKPGVLKRITRYFKDLSGEVKKVVWPTKKQVKNNTLVVAVFCIIAAVFVCGLDFILSILVELLIQHDITIFS